MTRTAYRIATTTPSYTADDLSGEGARLTGGRWNRKGIPMIYASTTIALAVLETMVHTSRKALPFNRYLVEIHIPKVLWDSAEVFNYLSAPKGWDAEPTGKPSIECGEAFTHSKGAAIMFVPSVIVPREQNIIINPLHPDISHIRAEVIEKWLYDHRLFHAA